MLEGGAIGKDDNLYHCTMVAPKIKGFSCSLYYLYNLSDHSHGIWQLYPSV